MMNKLVLLCDKLGKFIDKTRYKILFFDNMSYKKYSVFKIICPQLQKHRNMFVKSKCINQIILRKSV